MGKARRKKGKNARRARQGQLGLTKTIRNENCDKKFKKKKEIRDEKKEKKKDLKKLGETICEKFGTEEKKNEKTPFVYVIHSSKVEKYARRLERDIRRVFLPYTSLDLRVTKKNNFKDFVVNSQFLGVSHLVVLTQTENNLNLRIIRNSQGPTLHFKIENYSLINDLQSIQKRSINYKKILSNSPLVILNGFSSSQEKHLQLTQTVIQHMFPSLDIDNVKLKSIKRVLLISFDSETNLIEFRHYFIKAVPSGLSKGTKKLMQNKIPDLSKYKDFSEFLLNPGTLSDSEYEGEQTELELPQEVNQRGLIKGQNTKIRLIEIGPRMTWTLIKIEEGINDGEVLYHSYIEKTNEELEALRKNAPKRKKRKLMREKNIEHMTIRKLKTRAKKLAQEKQNSNFTNEKLIQEHMDVASEPPDELN